MPETDIYKKRESMPYGSGQAPQKKNRRKRSSSRRAFDDKDRKRRSKNTGLRRIIHLAKKKENEKVFWITLGGFIVLTIVLVSIWQFGVLEAKVRDAESEYERNLEYDRIPKADDNETRNR
jgi:hypothetical protein